MPLEGHIGDERFFLKILIDQRERESSFSFLRDSDYGAGLSRRIRGISERSKSEIPIFLTPSSIRLSQTIRGVTESLLRL